MYFSRILVQDESNPYNGKELPIFSKAKKTTGFKSYNTALNALEKAGKKGIWGQGRIYKHNRKTGEKDMVLTIAL